MILMFVSAIRLVLYVVVALTIGTFLQGKPIPVWGAWVTALATVFTLNDISYLASTMRVFVKLLTKEEK